MEEKGEKSKSEILPDKATMSLAESPWALKVEIRVVRLDVGAGITPVFAAVKLAVLESLLPTFTFQKGPPSYKIQLNILWENKINILWTINYFTNKK